MHVSPPPTFFTEKMSHTNRWCKATLSNGNGYENSIRIVGATNIEKTVKFLSKMCNINTKVPPAVHMTIFRGVLPHSTSMTTSSSTLHFMLNKFFRSDCLTYECELMDMDNCMLDIQVNDWDTLAGNLEEMRGGDDLVKRWGDVTRRLDMITSNVITNTETKIKVCPLPQCVCVLVVYIILTVSWPHR